MHPTPPSRLGRRALALAALAPVGLMACGGSSDSQADAAPSVATGTSADAPTTDPAAGSGGGAPGPTGDRGVGAQGTVSTIDGDTVTIESQAADGTITQSALTTTADTTVTELVAGTLADLAVGDTVTVSGTTGDDGTLTADTVSTGLGFGGGGFPGTGGGMPAGTPPGGSMPEFDGTPPGGSMPEFDGTPPGGSMPEGGFPRGGPGGGFTRGEITEITDTGLTIATDDDTLTTVAVSEATTITVAHDLALADLAVGATVTVISDDDGTAAAITVRGEP